MHKGRLEAFSDGVFAVLITILVLELKVPHGADWAAIRPLVPAFASYVLSFVYLGIYWNNHHHMLQAATHVTGAVLWANLFLLFWLSLIPFFTAWMGENGFERLPVAVYGGNLFLAGVAYTLLERILIGAQGKDSRLKGAVGMEIKGWTSTTVYLIGMVVAWLWIPWVALAAYAAVALVWFIPDRRIERSLGRGS